MGNPEYVELFRVRGRAQRRCESYRDIRMGDGVGLKLRNTLDDVGILEQGARHAGIDVTLGTCHVGEQPGEVAGTGGIVGNLVVRLHTRKLQRLRRLAIGVTGRVGGRTRRVGGRCGYGVPEYRETPRSRPMSGSRMRAMSSPATAPAAMSPTSFLSRRPVLRRTAKVRPTAD